MILFFKHIARTIKRAPWQPLLILLTLTLTVAVSVTAFRFYSIFSQNAKQNRESYTAAGDILITPSHNSTLRMLFCEDAVDTVQDRGQVLGEYALTFFHDGENGKKLISGSAVDLVSADRFYDFAYLEYGSFTTENLHRSVVISEKMAKELSLSVGDTLKVTLFDSELTYTVEAIARGKGLLAERDMLIQTEGLLRYLAKYIPQLGSLGDAFAPCNRIMIRTDEAETLVTELSDVFSDYHVEATYADSQSDYYVLVETVMVSLLAALILTLSAMLIAGSLSLVHLQRRTEYALFAAAGASEYQLGVLLMIESISYALLGGILGCLLATPMLSYAGGLFAWNEYTAFVGIAGWIFGITVSLGIMLLCTLYQIKVQQKTPPLAILQENGVSQHKAKRKTSLFPLTLTVLFSLAIIFTPTRLRYLPGIAAAFCLVWLLYTAVPKLLYGLASTLEKRLDKAAHPKVSLLLAIKNIRNLFPLRHVCRLLAVLFATVLTLAVCHNAISSQHKIINGSITGEITALNVPDETVKKLKENGTVLGAMTIGQVSGVKLENGYSAIAVVLSGDTQLCADPDALPLHYPQAGQAVLSAGIAKLLDVSVGESTVLTMQGSAVTVTVSDILNINANVVYLDADSIETSRKIACFKLAKNSSETELIYALEQDGITVIDKGEIWKSVPATLGGFLDLSRYTLAISVLLALTGCGNLLSGQYRMRKREREILTVTGADRKTRFGIYRNELLLLLAFAAFMALIFGALICGAVNVAVGSFGYILF